MKLCDVCSKLDTQRLTHPLYPCRRPLPCSAPPVKQFGTYVDLGSVDSIKSRRSSCDICKLIAERLDEEPADLDGRCRMTESAEFCNFKLPTHVKARDPTVTHFHLTQATVVFDTSVADRFQGPSLPWELKERDTKSTHFIFNLQAKARSAVEAGDLMDPPKTEQQFLDTIGGRYVGEQVNSQLIRAWLRRCERRHGKECIPSSNILVGSQKVPKYLVDVVKSCIVEAPSKSRYVALSYVWGKDTVFTHEKKDTQRLRQNDSLNLFSIPSTIRDSMALVRDIGERYIWVDSLCIVQDDQAMKGPEIKRMGSIYSRALFTIIAAGGDNANSGLVGVRPGSRKQMQETLKQGEHELLTVIDVRRTRSGIETTTWAERAWTFQERVLSNRVLVFSEDQVYWSCRAASWSEERATEDVRDIDRLHLSFPQYPTGDSLPWTPLDPPDYCNVYDDLLSGYRQRNLKYNSDLVNAFSGVSEILSTVQKDTFLWGLPESMFSYALTWHFTGRYVRNDEKVPILDSKGTELTIPFPSWSWAAWSGKEPNPLPFLHAGDSTNVRPMYRFSIVDNDHNLVEIQERTWDDWRPSESIRGLMWQNDDALPPLTNRYPPLPASRTGQLRFWTQYAYIKDVIRSWRIDGPGQVQYVVFPSSEEKANVYSSAQHRSVTALYRSEIVDEAFIVIAAGGREMLILLAVEYKDGVAYRVGYARVDARDWVRVGGGEWRFVTLG